MAKTEIEEESKCGKPCPPTGPCDECAAYWTRMEREGYWDTERHRWTDKGWKEITK
jgi:hypothetical protein